MPSTAAMPRKQSAMTASEIAIVGPTHAGPAATWSSASVCDPTVSSPKWAGGSAGRAAATSASA